MPFLTPHLYDLLQAHSFVSHGNTLEPSPPAVGKVLIDKAPARAEFRVIRVPQRQHRVRKFRERLGSVVRLPLHKPNEPPSVLWTVPVPCCRTYYQKTDTGTRGRSVGG